jgi:hypothetical protein
MNVDRRELTQHLLMTAVVFAGGLFAGLTIAAELALQTSPAMELPPWAQAVDQMRYVSVGVVTAGLLAMAGLDYTASA